MKPPPTPNGLERNRPAGKLELGDLTGTVTAASKSVPFHLAIRAVGGSVLDQNRNRSFSRSKDTIPSPPMLLFQGFCVPFSREEKTTPLS